MTTFKNQELIGLDFETYSSVDLFAHGLERYVDHDTFQPLRAALCLFDSPANNYYEQDLDLIRDHNAKLQIELAVRDRFIVAHNAGFERRVLQAMGLNYSASKFIDSAVIARAMGAAGKLEAAAPQLLGTDKMPDGRRLIQLFSVPGKYQEYEGTKRFVPRITEEHPDDWDLFGEYCVLDARLGLRIAQRGIESGIYTESEHDFNALTMEMNQLGWHVDVETVEEMQRRYLENLDLALQEFRERFDAHDLNLNSLKQLKDWCRDRGIKAASFNEESCAKMSRKIKAKLDAHDQDGQLLEPEKYDGYHQVWSLLETKLLLGGSSLKKLKVILDTVGEDGRLRDQYLHVGAGQTYRTTGRSVQMQNLKRLAEPDDMTTLMDLDSEWDNTKLAQNLRQVFTSEHPEGQLLVGDFASVESRGLAWYAGATWKLDEFFEGKDMYKVLASGFYSKPYDQIDKAERTFGKVGELSCGYQAGAGAVQSFAAGMGVELSEGEAAKLVADWRRVNPEVVDFWERLDEALHRIMGGAMSYTVPVSHGYRLLFTEGMVPQSLNDQRKGTKTITITLLNERNEKVFTRIFHGCYMAGKSINYHKPSQLKNGKLWSDRFTDPKTKQVRFYSIYGGKLAGILTQSLCREMFFTSLSIVSDWAGRHPNIKVIGQFHDEIVLDWQPQLNGGLTVDEAMAEFKAAMEYRTIPSFPLVAEIKNDYRYTK